MTAYRQALAETPGLAAARMGLDAILERARTRQPSAQLAGLLLEAYADPSANWDAIGWGAANQLVVGWPADTAPETMAGNALLLEFLRKSLNRDATLERKLIALRSATATLLQQPSPSASVVELAAALAEQAWQNEYIWPDDPAVPDGPAGAMYRPSATPRPEVVEERRLAAELPTIAPITDGVSQRSRRCTRPIPIRAGRICRAARRSTSAPPCRPIFLMRAPRRSRVRCRC
jgi:hypothetical protein